MIDASFVLAEIFMVAAVLMLVVGFFLPTSTGTHMSPRSQALVFSILFAIGGFICLYVYALS